MSWMNLIQDMSVIDSNNLEHVGRPETALHFSASCSGIAAGYDAIHAGVAELVDALDLGSSDESCGGSSPSARTKRSSSVCMTNTGGPASPVGDLGQPNHRRRLLQSRVDPIDNVGAIRPDETEED